MRAIKIIWTGEKKGKEEKWSGAIIFSLLLSSLLALRPKRELCLTFTAYFRFFCPSYELANLCPPSFDSSRPSFLLSFFSAPLLSRLIIASIRSPFSFFLFRRN